MEMRRGISGGQSAAERSQLNGGKTELEFKVTEERKETMKLQ